MSYGKTGCPIDLKIIGDDGTQEQAQIAEVRELDSGKPIGFDGSGRIGPISFQDEVEGAIEVVLQDGLRCALEVSANAN